MRNTLRVLALVSLIVTALSLPGCTKPIIEYVDRDASYSTQSALTLLDETTSARLSQTGVGESRGLRSTALAELRREGAEQSEAASLITSTIPQDTRGVPYYVERADFEGEAALVVLEATGPPQGTLSDARLWILSEEGDVLFVGNR